MKIEEMLSAIGDIIGRCEASELEVYEALLEEAEGWRMRLQELRADARAREADHE
jgi:hypothetical protein